MAGPLHATDRFRVPVSRAPHSVADRAQHMSARLRGEKPTGRLELGCLVRLRQLRYRAGLHGAARARSTRTDPFRGHGGTETLEILHPNFVEQNTKKTINDLSALVVLVSSRKIVSIWPGDLHFSTLVDAVGEIQIDVLVGPHHGGVRDSKKELKARDKNLRPKEVFISVGSLNNYDHPRAPYLKNLVKKGCSITCSEITSKCDIARVSQRLPVFDGSGMLGLPANDTGVPCRGTRRLRFSNGCLEGSKLDVMHLQEILQLKEPLCRRANS